MKQNETKFTPKNAKIFYCNNCSIGCSKESDFVRHLSTRKHKMKQNETKMKQNETDFTPKNAALNMVTAPFSHAQNREFMVSKTGGNGGKQQKNAATTWHECECCGLELKSRTTLWRHKKICLNNQDKQTTQLVESYNDHVSSSDFKEIIMTMMKDNKEFQKSFIEILPQIQCGVTNSHNINTNSNNTNNFNIQMFLNDHCKNAMNLTDFIESLPITNETYDNTIENGLTKTITNMVVNGLNNMDILERPIHCTDPSRKIMYIKDNDVWEKDNELQLLLKGITTLALKQRTTINKWQDANHGWDKDENLQTRMTRLVFNSMTNVETDEKETNKIIRAIGKSTHLTNEIKDEYKH
jgi:hypothetical protein